MEDLPYGILLEAVQEHKTEHARRQRRTISTAWPFKKSDSKELRVAPKGSLVTAISKHESGANYKTLSEPCLLLCCKLEEVCKFNSQEKDLLEGVEHLQDRIEILHKLDWVQKLRIGSLVYVTIPTIPIPMKGAIQYIGVLHGEIGTKFFVELMEEKLEGTSDDKDKDLPSSESSHNRVVFVSMDQLTQQASVDAARVEEIVSPNSPANQPSDQDTSKQPHSQAFISSSWDSKNAEIHRGLTTVDFAAIKTVGITDRKTIGRQQTALHKFEKKQKKITQQSEQHKRIKQAQEELGLDDSSSLDFSLLDIEKQRKLLEDAVLHETKEGQNSCLQSPSTPNDDNSNTLEVGSRIQFGNPPCYGIIKWIGDLPSIACTMAGVEVENPVDDFTATYLYSDGWHQGVQLFHSESNKGLFLPLSGLHSDQRPYSNATNKIVDPCHGLQVVETSTQTIELPSDSVTDDKLQLDPEIQSDEQLRRFMVETKESIWLIQEDNVKLKTSNADLQSQLSITQQQLHDLQNKNEQLQKQIFHTQQQLEGIQSMIACSSRLQLVARNEIILGEEIGRGAWAMVYKATFRGNSVAAKQLHSCIVSSETKALFQREMEIALSCRHQNIVTFLGATLDDDSPMILMELMDFNLRSAYQQGGVTYGKTLKVAHEIATALQFLHTRPNPVIHRDVSSANVLLKVLHNGEWLAKLGDLGTAKMQQQTTTPSPGAWAYAAPEAPTPEKHSPKMDVYSFGVLVIETLTQTHPFRKLDTLKAQVQQQYPLYNQLVTSCTKQHSSDRLTMYDVLVQLDEIAAAAANSEL